jgi:putative spermidine/putrescine transport system permease protein
MAKRAVGIATIAVLAFLYLPILVIFLYSFNADRGQSWPITEWTTHWFGDAIGNQEVRDAFLLSLQAAIGATLIAIVLGTTGSGSSGARRSRSSCCCRWRSRASSPAWR